MPKHMFDSEKATETADLPHRYDSQDGSRQHPCQICSTSVIDPRHIAWEQAHLREVAGAAAPEMVREIGS